MDGATEGRHRHALRFVLNPFVRHVHGTARAALYDLHRRRIFPIPRSASWVLDRCDEASDVQAVLDSIPDADDRGIAAGYLDEFSRLDFGRFLDAERAAPVRAFREASMVASAGHLKWVSIDLRAGPADAVSIDAWMGIITAARRLGPAHQLTVFVDTAARNHDGVASLVEHAASLAFHHVEVVFPPDDPDPALAVACRDRGVAACVQDGHGEAGPAPATEVLRNLGVMPRIARSEGPAPVTESALVCDHQAFVRLRNGSTHAGSLHIAPCGDVFPWALERHHRIGRVRDADELEALLRSHALVEAWAHGKDAIQTCRECEFRYACPNSYTFRVEPEDIHSAPTNCLYDPHRGTWRYERADACFGGSSEPIVGTSRYFEVHATPARPLPGPYFDALDRAVEHVCDSLGLERPREPMRYLFYPSLDVLQADLAHRGKALAGLTEVSGAGERPVVRTSYPCHIHEIVHALLHAWNPTPRLFVSEACATLFGRARAIGPDLVDPTGSASGIEIRVDGRASRLVLDDVLAFDAVGLPLGPLRNSDVHAIAGWLQEDRRLPLRIEAWFDARDERDMPGYFYEAGGSFFLWLLQTHGQATFRAFYRSGQRQAHFEAFYPGSVATLAGKWREFLTQHRAKA